MVYIKEDLVDMLLKGDSLYFFMNNIRIGRSGVCKFLKGLNVYKVIGLDIILARFFYDFVLELILIMIKLF